MGRGVVWQACKNLLLYPITIKLSSSSLCVVCSMTWPILKKLAGTRITLSSGSHWTPWEWILSSQEAASEPAGGLSASLNSWKDFSKGAVKSTLYIQTINSIDNNFNRFAKVLWNKLSSSWLLDPTQTSSLLVCLNFIYSFPSAISTTIHSQSTRITQFFSS